jgi:dTDP-4-dehydrorhamnose reductase
MAPHPAVPDRRLLVIGGSGELGRQLVANAHGWEVLATTYQHPLVARQAIGHQLDVRDRVAVHELIRDLAPNAVIHAAVSDRSRSTVAGDEEFRLSVVEGARNVVEAAAAIRARCIVLSTDLVFDGNKGNYTETDPPNPLMPYAQAKVEMEQVLAGMDADLVIVRTSLVLSLNPMARHVAWIVDALRRGERLDLFTDERRCPTWSDELASALLELTALDYRGLLHVAGPEAITRYALGLKLADTFGLDRSPIRPALSAVSGMRRPLNCTLDSSHAYGILKTRLHGPSARLGG